MLRRLGAQGLRNLFPIVNGTTHRSYSKLYEPDYLAALKPEFPIYEHLNIQIKGYDFALLESYQRFLHNLGDSMDLEVSDGWAIPPQKLQVQRLKPSSTIVDTEYSLTLYERTIQVSDISAPIYPTLLRLAQAGLPEGISFEVVEHRPEHDEIRYVPDRELLELKDQLEEMGGARKPRKGKK